MCENKGNNRETGKRGGKERCNRIINTGKKTYMKEEGQRMRKRKQRKVFTRVSMITMPDDNCT